MQAVVSDLAQWVGQPHQLHALHHTERPWPQTNCSVDLFIELVAAYGHDPVWMLAFTLTQDFEGDHFTFFKAPSDDLEALYGLSIHELAVWDDLQAHVLEQLQRNRVVLVEVDSHYLPDTQGVTYREGHSKTTLGIYAMDPTAKVLHYFHNEVRAQLAGEDYDGCLQRLPQQQHLLLPYTEFVKVNAAQASPHPKALAWQLLQHHWHRRPSTNPFTAYAQALPQHLAQLTERGQPYFHAYAFNTLRQFGANFGLMASLLERWPDTPLAQAASCACQIADEAKVLQFKLARAVARGKPDALVDGAHALAAVYDQLFQHLGQALAD